MPMSRETPTRRHPGARRMLKLLPFLLSALILSACGQTATESANPSEASATPEASPTPFIFPTLRPTQTPDLSGSQACIDCHSDQQRLIDTADQVEEKEAESSGEG